MAKIQFLTILLVVTCFLGGVVSVTDKEFEDLVTFVHQQATILQEQSQTNHEQTITIKKQSETIDKQSALIKIMLKKIDQRDVPIKELTTRDTGDKTNGVLEHKDQLIQNTTIEERVTLLEIQVTDMREDIMEINEDVMLVVEDVNFLFDEQVIQDEKLLNLEQETEEIDEQLILIDDDLATTLTLDFHVTVLEENGGGDWNSSVAELDVRVETLEGTAADHETRISDAETDINDLEGTTSDHETRLRAAEENIQGLQMTDVELDSRVTALEETGGGGNAGNDTIAFHTALTSYSSIPDESAVEFNEVVLNEGNGYDSTTGTFTVPSGGDGFYYLSAYFVVRYYEYAGFDIQINGETLCTAYTDEEQQIVPDFGQAACTAASYATEGDEVQVVYRQGTDTTPLLVSSSYYYNGFTGFRI